MKEIERLIEKLEIDREILTDQEDELIERQFLKEAANWGGLILAGLCLARPQIR